MGKRRIKPKLGDVFEFRLPNGKYAYGRKYKDIDYGFYKKLSDTPNNPPIGERDFFFISGFQDGVIIDGLYPIVGNDPFDNEEDAWPSPTFSYNDLFKKYYIYYKGISSVATEEECKGLEKTDGKEGRQPGGVTRNYDKITNKSDADRITGAGNGATSTDLGKGRWGVDYNGFEGTPEGDANREKAVGESISLGSGQDSSPGEDGSISNGNGSFSRGSTVGTSLGLMGGAKDIFDKIRDHIDSSIDFAVYLSIGTGVVEIIAGLYLGGGGGVGGILLAPESGGTSLALSYAGVTTGAALIKGGIIQVVSGLAVISMKNGDGNKYEKSGRGKSRENKDVKKIAKKYKIDENKFGRYIEDVKYDEGIPNHTNFTWKELEDLAQNFMK